MMLGMSTSLTTLPDESVVERACLGSREAYDELVTRYRVKAVRIARSFVYDRDLAEDIAQEAFVRTFGNLWRLQSAGAFQAYLMRTIVRICIDHSRKLSSKEIPLDLDPPPTNPESSVDETIYVHGVLGQLSEKLRAVIVLRDVQGMDYHAIAQVLALPVGTVRSRLAAARASFKELYLSGTAAEREA